MSYRKVPKKFIKKHLSGNDKFRKNKLLKWLGPILLNPLLWHLHRRNVAKGAAIGVFCAFLPVPIQMFLAAIFSIIWRANLPVSQALVWISNPITIPIMLVAAYKVGILILGLPASRPGFTMTAHWISNELAVLWKPVLLGSVICGAVAAILAYFLVRILWRLWIVREWEKRKRRRKETI